MTGQRVRLLLKADVLSCKRSATAIEVGLRYDGGEGDSGLGAVVDASTAYINSAAGLTMEAKLHTLLGRDDYAEWGISGLISKRATGNGGRGLAFSLTPSYA